MQGPPSSKRLRGAPYSPPSSPKRHCGKEGPQPGTSDHYGGPGGLRERPPSPSGGPPVPWGSRQPGYIEDAEGPLSPPRTIQRKTAETAAPPLFSKVLHRQLSSGEYLLQLLQHVLRQRLRAALRGHLHTISLGAPKEPPKKQTGFTPSPVVEAMLRGEGDGAASLRARTSSSSSCSEASVESVAGALAAKLMCCLQLKEKSSVLVMGPRGSGATTAVECALRYVQQQVEQQQQQQQQQQKQLRRLLVVRVNCSLYGSDTAILQGIVRRLCASLGQQQLLQQQQQQQQQGSTFDDWARRLRCLLQDSCETLGLAVVVVLDRAEICCLSSRDRSSSSSSGSSTLQQQQLLLYNLFDLQHGEGLHIFTLCLSPVSDLTDFMEKRIRSRFTMQKLLLSAAAAAAAPQQLLDFIRNKLLYVEPQELLQVAAAAANAAGAAAASSTTHKKHTAADAAAADAAAAAAARQDLEAATQFCRAYNAAIEKELSNPYFIAACKRALALGRNARSFLVAAVKPLLQLSPPMPQLEAAAAAAAAWGAPQVPEALSPIHLSLRHGEQQRSPWRGEAAAAAAAVVTTEDQQQLQQQMLLQELLLQQQEEQPLNLCADAIDPHRVSYTAAAAAAARQQQQQQ
ncbi:hypothetical protein, conserved [Eimeria maxima]|uniref:Origin recognition complex subunit 4 n=1 Tax=Eimeria maxima TaxID=5804 RepID=U6M3J5_EIMMA|nr:hypothetical protein, conserved [Eimeria maxima]CDJ57633.1 hypothetical protein, conserved [Eimeria maxima]